MALCTPKRLALLQASSNPNAIDWDELTYCVRDNATVFHKDGARCYWCCDACKMGFSTYLNSSRVGKFFVLLCDEHYAMLADAVRKVRDL